MSIPLSGAGMLSAGAGAAVTDIEVARQTKAISALGITGVSPVFSIEAEELDFTMFMILSTSPDVA
jgi:hypothetical protein